MDDEQIVTTSEPGGGRRRRITLIGGIVAALLVGAFALLAALALVDPFGWHLLDRITGRYDPVLISVPQASIVYVGMDLSSDNREAANRLFEPFAQAMEEAAPEEKGGLFEGFEKDLEETFGITMEEDVNPWVGRRVGFALLDLDLDLSGDLEGYAWVLAVETRDRKASDAFLDKLGEGWSIKEGLDFLTETYRGVTLTAWDSENLEDRLAYGRAGDVVLLAPSVDDLKASVDAQQGESLADLESYQEFAPKLPEDRALTFFIDVANLEGLMTDLTQGVAGIPAFGVQQVPLQGLLMGVSMVEVGLQIDSVTAYDLEELTETQKAVLDSQSMRPVIDEFAPQESLVFFTGRNLSLSWEQTREALAEDNEDFEESMSLFEREMGFGLEDLFKPLDGEFALLVMPRGGGQVEAEIPLNIAFLSQTSDPASLVEVFDLVAKGLRENLFMQVSRKEQGELTLFEVQQMFTNEPSVTFGVGRGYMYIGSPGGVFEGLFDGGPSLAESERYQRVWRSFPEGFAPIFYADVEGILGALREFTSTADLEDFEDGVRFIRPITSLASARGPVEDGIVLSRFIVFIEAEGEG